MSRCSAPACAGSLEFSSATAPPGNGSGDTSRRRSTSACDRRIMSEPILVRGGVSGWLIACRVLAALTAMAGVAVLLFGSPSLGVALCVSGGGLWIVLEVYAAVQ